MHVKPTQTIFSSEYVSVQFSPGDATTPYITMLEVIVVVAATTPSRMNDTHSYGLL